MSPAELATLLTIVMALGAILGGCVTWLWCSARVDRLAADNAQLCQDLADRDAELLTVRDQLVAKQQEIVDRQARIERLARQAAQLRNPGRVYGGEHRG